MQISSGTAGDCHDTGAATYPAAGGQVLGRVLSTNGAGGTYDMELFPDEIQATNLPAPGAIGGTTPAAGSFTTLTGTTLATTTNCAAVGTAANPSLVACSAAAAGAFSCSTTASTGTCVVSTTAVTANSEIFVTQNDDEGTRLSVTCNTGVDLPAAAPLLAAKSAGVSFTINLGTVSVNPACFDYLIIN